MSSTAALPASTSSTAAITRAFSSVSPFGHSIGRKRSSVWTPPRASPDVCRTVPHAP